MSMITLEEPNTGFGLDIPTSLWPDSLWPDSFDAFWSDSSTESQMSETMAKPATGNSEEGPAPQVGGYDGLSLADITPSSTPSTGECNQSTGTQKSEAMEKPPTADSEEPQTGGYDGLSLADITPSSTPSSTPCTGECNQSTGTQKSEAMAKPPTANSTEEYLAPYAGEYDGLLPAGITPSSTPYTGGYNQSMGAQRSEIMAKPPTANSTEGRLARQAGEYDGLPLASSSTPYTGEYYQSTGTTAVPTSEDKTEASIPNKHPRTQSPNHKNSDQVLESADHIPTPPQSTPRAPSSVLGKRKGREQPKSQKQKRVRGPVRGRDYPLHENDYDYVDAPSQNMDNGYWKRMALRYEEKASKALEKWQEEGNTLAPEASLRARPEVPAPSHKEASLDFWYSEYAHVIGVLQQINVDVQLEKRRKRSPTPTQPQTQTFNPQQNLSVVPSTQPQLPQYMSQGIGQPCFMDPTYYDIHGAGLYPALIQDDTGYPLVGQAIAAPVPFNLFFQPAMGQLGQQQ